MIKRIIFGLLFLLLCTKSVSAQTVPCLERGILTTNSATGFFFIIEKEIVEWRTISKTIPIRGNITTLDYNPTLLNQVGTKYLGTFAQIEWKGKTKEFELERTLIKSDTVLERTISEFSTSLTMDN